VTDPDGRAREMLTVLELGDSGTVLELCSSRIRGFVKQGWSLEDHLRDLFRPGLDDLAGSPRTVTGVQHVSPTQVRLTVVGERGEGLVTLRLDEAGNIDGFALDREVFDGIANLVINCPDDRVTETREFYAAILGDDQWRVPFLVFDEGHDYHPPIWADLDRPQQIHVDVRVPDLVATEEIVLARGAMLRHVGSTHRVYTDPIGHPFCLVVDDDQPLAVRRIVIDCPEPRELAPFYVQLTGMSDVVKDSVDLVEIGRPDGRLPMLGFRRVSPYVPPRWPDPAYPAQMHFDLKFDDASAARAIAESLGAVLQPTGGSCPVYVDPVGHPHCICMHGE
jgi:hypothetical protein